MDTGLDLLFIVNLTQHRLTYDQKGPQVKGCSYQIGLMPCL